MMSKEVLMFLEKLKEANFGESGQASSQYRGVKRILGSTWKSLPDVRDLHIKVKNYNSLYEYFGLKKRNPPELKWERKGNAKYNVYALRQLKRLEKMREDPIKYFKVSKFLMSRSKVFRVLTINSVFPN